jgi:hypothetical protein
MAEAPPQLATHNTQCLLSHRIHALLHVPPKYVVNVDLKGPISQWLGNTYGETSQQANEITLSDMNKSRTALANLYRKYAMKESAVSDSIQTIVGLQRHAADSGLYSDLEKSKFFLEWRAYYHQLQSLIQKTIPAPSSSSSSSEEASEEPLARIPELHVEWSHWLGEGHEHMVTPNLHDELCCHVFNLAAIRSLMGAVLPNNLVPAQGSPESQAALRHRVANFRLAAIGFQKLEQLLTDYKIEFDELNPRIVRILMQLMLAQAQECVYLSVKTQLQAPTAQLALAQSCLASRVYYDEAKQACEALSKEELLHWPRSWWIHAGTAFVLTRICALAHYQWSLDTNLEFGKRAGCWAKCTRLLQEFIEDLRLEDPQGALSDESTYESLHMLADWMLQQNELFIADARQVYRQPVGQAEEIDRISFEMRDVVSIAGKVPVETEPEASLGQFIDSFKVISGASAYCWLKYRNERSRLYYEHVQKMQQVYSESSAFWNDLSSLLLLYFVHHRFFPDASQKKDTSESYYQTRLGSLLYRMRTQRNLSNLVARANALVEKDQLEALTLLGRFTHECSLNKNLGENHLLHKKILDTEADLSKCICEQMKQLQLLCQPAGQLLAQLRTEDHWAELTLGRYFCFHHSKAPDALAGGGLERLPNEDETHIRATAHRATVLLHAELDQCRAEDELAKQVIQDSSVPMTELSPDQLRNQQDWLDKKLNWLNERIEEIFVLTGQAAELRRLLRDTAPIGPETLTLYIQRLAGPATVPPGPDIPVADDSAPVLVRLYQGLVVGEQCARDLDVATQLLRVLRRDSDALAKQLYAIRRDAI